MSVPAVVFLVASSLYLGFQWTIRVLVYPQFAAVPAGSFPAYELGHRRRVSLAVGPLFAALVAAAALLLVDGPAGAPPWEAPASAAAVAALLALTAVGAVPQHAVLSRGFDAAAFRRLLVVDSLRLAVAVLATALGVLLLVD